jgi:hypothetical protein
MASTTRTVTIMTCDICQATFSENGKRSNYKMTLSGNSLDRGTPVGPAYLGGKYDLCPTCYGKITKTIDNIRREK